MNQERAVHRFPMMLICHGIQEIGMPSGAKILHVGTKGCDMDIHIWAEVPTNPKVKWEVRRFRIFETGEPLPTEDAHHIGTVIIGLMVYHIYELEGL